MSSSAPAYPSAVSFLPVLHPVSGDPLLPHSTRQSPPEADSQGLAEHQSSRHQELSKLLYTTLTYLGLAAEKCLGHLGSTTVALLPSGTCWRRSWGGASGAQAAPTAAHTEILGAAGHLKAPPPSTDSGTASHLRECCRGEDLCGAERKDWKNFSRGFSLSIRIQFMPTSWLEKCSLYHWEFFITGL